MSTKPLQEGISILYDMESNNYLITRYIDELQEKINNLGKQQYFGKQPSSKKVTYPGEMVLEYTGNYAWYGIIIGVLFGALVGFSQGDGFFNTIITLIINIFIFGLIFLACGAIVGVIIGFMQVSSKNKTFESEYQDNLRQHECNLQQDQARIQQELQQRLMLQKQLGNMIARKSKSEELLETFYQQMNIDNNYRNIVPIAYMNEFIRLGISTHLEGADGLYYLVHKELRWDQMQYTLNDISEKLDTIIDQNHRLYAELKQLNSICERLLHETEKSVALAVQNNKTLNSIKEIDEVNAYNIERTRKETEFQSFMQAYYYSTQ